MRNHFKLKINTVNVHEFTFQVRKNPLHHHLSKNIDSLLEAYQRHLERKLDKNAITMTTFVLVENLNVGNDTSNACTKMKHAAIDLYRKNAQGENDENPFVSCV